jgi:hypothetical protein
VHLTWLLVWVTWPAWGMALALGAGSLGNRVTGSHPEAINAWSMAAFVPAFLVCLAVGYNRRCPACRKRLLWSDYRPKHCDCGALLNDRHSTAPWH